MSAQAHCVAQSVQHPAWVSGICRIQHLATDDDASHWHEITAAPASVLKPAV